MPVIGVPPLHLVLHDRHGSAAVVEWVEGGVSARQPSGRGNEQPPARLASDKPRNYVNQTAIDVPPLTVDGVTVAPLGEGSGMLGLPGDFTPPSRFVRAAAFAAAAWKPKTAAGGVNTVLHLLSSFDIVKGVVRDATPAGISAQDLEASATTRVSPQSAS